MLDVALVVVQMALGIALPAAIVRWDEPRLTPQQLSRSWNPTTFWIAVVVFGPLCLPVHFGKTRRTLLGVMLGFVALGLALGVQVAVASALASLGGE